MTKSMTKKALTIVLAAVILMTSPAAVFAGQSGGDTARAGAGILDIDNFDDFFAFVLYTMQPEIPDYSAAYCETCGFNQVLFWVRFPELMIRLFDLPRDDYLDDFDYLVEHISRHLIYHNFQDAAGGFQEISEYARAGIENYFHVNNIIFNLLLEHVLLQPLGQYVHLSADIMPLEVFAGNLDECCLPPHTILPNSGLVVVLN